MLAHPTAFSRPRESGIQKSRAVSIMDRFFFLGLLCLHDKLGPTLRSYTYFLSLPDLAANAAAGMTAPPARPCAGSGRKRFFYNDIPGPRLTAQAATGGVWKVGDG